MNQDDPVEDMVGCERWCEESNNANYASKNEGHSLGQACRMDMFSTTREIYTQLLRDRDQGVQNNQQIREKLLQTAARPIPKECSAGLYCATVSTPMIESLIVEQSYDFPSGPLDNVFR